MNLKVIYDCGCESSGHNVASFCPTHDRPIKWDKIKMPPPEAVIIFENTYESMETIKVDLAKW